MVQFTVILKTSMGVGWNLPQDDVLCLSIVWQLLSNKFFFNFCGKKWNLDSGTRRSLSCWSSYPLPLTLYFEHILGGKNDNICSSAETPLLCFCVAKVIYAHMDRVILFQSGFFPPKYVQFLELLFSNSFMLYFCSFQLVVALYYFFLLI